MKITVVGEKNSFNGIGNAFERHFKVLESLAEVEVFAFGKDSRAQNEVGYAHGGPTAVGTITRQARQIGYLVCESTELANGYFKAFPKLDEVWTCSEFCKNILEENTEKPVVVIPHYTTQFEHVVNENEEPVFLIALNGNSRLLRKLPSLAIQAIKAVSPRAKLVLKLSNVQTNTTNWLLRLASGLRVELITDKLSLEELTSLYRRIDIVVSTHASEGFGLHLLEAMAMGKRVVATGYSGNLDFMNEDNSFLIDYSLARTTDELFKGYWASPSLRSTQEQIACAIESHHNDSFSESISRSVQHFNFDNTVKLTNQHL